MSWRRKFASRKFWMAVAGFVMGLLVYMGKPESDAAQVAALVLQAGSIFAYCIGEGLADGGSSVPNIDIIPLPFPEEQEEEWLDDERDA